MKVQSFYIGEVMRDTTMVVELQATGIRWFKFRLWLGAQLLKLAAKIVGCGIDIKSPGQQ